VTPNRTSWECGEDGPAAETVEAPGPAGVLLRWAYGQRPDLPWRGEKDPYRIWVSEVMLQQTRAATVEPYYLRFLDRFPAVQSLAAAELDDVLKAWEGLGYYGRARSLHAAARLLMAQHGGQLPSTSEELLALPGIGEYAAGAIASFAFGRDAPALDGNGLRVLARFYAVTGDPALPGVRRQLWDLARDLLPSGRAGAFNQALMDLGATVCTPSSPRCDRCPWSPHCRALALGTVDDLPTRTPRRPLPHYDMVAGMIWREGEVLIARRPPRGLLGGLWALPGGRREGEESLEEALVRTVTEGLGVAVALDGYIGAVEHAYTHFRITLHGYRCHYVRGEPAALTYAAWLWVAPKGLDARAFAVTDRKLMHLAHVAECRG
jgi:A/G-specific adenine glycosylase